MNYQQKDWLGSWQNFESYLVSTAPAMQACWTQAEEAAKALPMFQAGVKTFWQRACGTALAGPVLGGWQIEAANAQDLRITWLDAAGQPLDSAVYHFTGALEKGLEGKVCAKFETAGALQHPQFRCLLAMPPDARAHRPCPWRLAEPPAFPVCSRLDRPCWYRRQAQPSHVVPHHVRWCRHPAGAVQHCATMHHLTCWTELPV